MLWRSSVHLEAALRTQKCPSRMTRHQMKAEYYERSRPTDEVGQMVLHGSLGPDEASAMSIHSVSIALSAAS